MDRTTLTHIGGELVVIGGLAFYFHRKTSQLQQELTTLQGEHKKLLEIVEEMQESINQLGAFVMQGRMPVSQPLHQPPPQPQPQQMQPRQRTPPRASQRGSQVPVAGVTLMMGAALPKQKQKLRRARLATPPESESDSGNETFDDKDLDNDLGPEFEELERGRCEDGVCKIGEQ